MPPIRDNLIKACGQEYARGHARSDGEMRADDVLRLFSDPSDEMVEAGARAMEPHAFARMDEGWPGEWRNVYDGRTAANDRKRIAIARRKARAAIAAALRAV